MAKPETKPMVDFWMGEPLGKLPRDELERLFFETYRALEAEREAHADTSISRINDIGRIARKRVRSPLARICEWLQR